MFALKQINDSNNIYTNTNYLHIVVSGNIGVGKSTFIDKFVKSLVDYKIIEESVIDNPYLDKFYTNSNDFAYKLQVYMALDRYNKTKSLIKNKTESLTKNKSVIYIQERNILEDKVFAITNKQLNKINLADYNTLNMLYDVFKPNIIFPDIVIYLDTDTDKCMERIKKRGRNCEKMISYDYLDKLNDNYRNLYVPYIKEKTLFIKYDWSNNDTKKIPISSIITDINKLLKISKYSCQLVDISNQET